MEGADGIATVGKQVRVCRERLKVVVVEFYCLFQEIDSRCCQQTERCFVQSECFICRKVAFDRRFH